MRSPANDSRSGRMSGMPPATDASKRRSTPAPSAVSNSSRPTFASSSLFAVTTGLPAFNASMMSSRAGSMPPMTSTTTSTSSATTTAAASWVNTDAGRGTSRSSARLRTATRVTCEPDTRARLDLTAVLADLADQRRADVTATEQPDVHRA